MIPAPLALTAENTKSIGASIALGERFGVSRMRDFLFLCVIL